MGTTTCGVQHVAAIADTVEETQSLNIPRAFAFVEDFPVAPSFKRIDAEIIEVAPWLKPEQQGLQLSHAELLQILRNAGFSGNGLKMAWAIVQKESSARPYAHNGNRNTGDNSYGLFQINMIDSLGTARLKLYDLEANEDLFDPAINADIAFKISGGGKNWGAWTTNKKAKEMLGSFPEG